MVRDLPARDVRGLALDWDLWAREDQLPPALAPNGAPWRVWLALGGRGAGKTRLGAEWVRARVLGRDGPPARRVALVAATREDLRAVMVEGDSGLLALHPLAERPRWSPARLRLEWPNGAVAQGYSAEEPDSLRGPQFDAAWGDEAAKWKAPVRALDTLLMALRLGEDPRLVLTTTPRPGALLRRLRADPGVAVTVAPTRLNRAHLAPGFVEALEARHAGTALGRQELMGEVVEDTEGALWTRALLERGRRPPLADYARVVVAVDPPAGRGRASVCGIVAAGLTPGGEAHVLADASVAAAAPDAWAAAACALYRALGADALVAEVNQGGAMVAAVVAAADPGVPVRPVTATRGKRLRAEPVAALFAAGRARLAGAFPALEDELCAFGPDGLAGGRSPDRLDAMVHAITALVLEAGPRVRGV